LPSPHGPWVPTDEFKGKEPDRRVW
jgi:hypothetical protein